MARPIGKAKVQHGAASTTITVTLPSHQDGDLLVMFLTQNDGTTAITESGTSNWTVKQPTSVTGSTRCTLAWRYVASGAPVANPTFTGSSSQGWSVQTVVIRDADATTPIHGTSGIGYNGVTFTANTADSPTIDTTSGAGANALLLYAWGFDTDTGSSLVQYCRPLSNDLIELGKEVGDVSQVTDFHVGSCVGYRIQGAVGTSTVVKAYSSGTVAGRGGNAWVVGIKNASGGSLAGDCRSGITEGFVAGTSINPYGRLGSIHNAPTWQAPSTNFPTAIKSIATMTALPNQGTSYSAFGTGAEYFHGQYSLNIEGANLATAFGGNPAWCGVSQAITSTDMTGKIYSLQWMASGIFITYMGDYGFVIAFKDSTGNWAAFQVRPKSLLFQNREISSQIDLENATPLDASAGAIDWSDVTALGYFFHRLPGSTAQHSMFIKNACLVDAATITGGGSGSPSSFVTLTDAANSWHFTGLANLQASAEVQAKYSVAIGDGSTPTYFKCSAQAFAFPLAYGETYPTSQYDWAVGANRVGITINAASGDTIDFSASSIVTTVAQAFTIASGSSTGATYSFSGMSLVGPWAVTWKTGVACLLATFSGCGEIAAKGANFTNCTITDTSSTDAAIAFDTSGATLDGCVIDGTGALYAIELGTAVTAITLTDCTLTAGSTDKIHVLKTLTNVAAGAFVVGVHYRINTVGTTDFTAIGASANTIGVNFTATGAGTGTGTADQAVKITISGTTSLAEADATTAGAPVWVAAPALYQVVVVSGFTAGSRIQIYDKTRNTELFNGTASAGNTVVSGTTATWTDPLSASATRAIRVRVAYVNGATAKAFVESTGLTCGITEGTESITYPISQVADTTYDSNAINGPSIYATSGITFTDAATDLVNISIAGGSVTWPTIYACFVYWIFTAAGIDDDVAYIDAPDTANYLLTSMKLKNTHTNPLTVTSGFGRSATTGLVADIIDTAGSTGNIFPTPDHVVAYATGSGALTAGDITNIWSAATRTITTTIPAAADNATAVLAAAVDGTVTLAESIRLHNSVLGGKVSGAGTGTETFRDLADTKNRVVATVDSDGNRTAITRTLT